MTSWQGMNRQLKPYAAGLVQVALQLNPRAVVTSVRRSKRKQTLLYLDWIRGRSPYPAARPGTSKHERGLAFDIGGLSSSQLRELGAIWTSWGGRWGGSFSNPDPIHFEA